MAAAGLTAALETHPDRSGGDQALETMRRGPANVRVNFDTGNIYYYNEGTTAVAELRRSPLRGERSPEDTYGGFKTHHFPTLGQGVVDYRRIFRILNEHGMRPFHHGLEGSPARNDRRSSRRPGWPTPGLPEAHWRRGLSQPTTGNSENERLMRSKPMTRWTAHALVAVCCCLVLAAGAPASTARQGPRCWI